MKLDVTEKAVNCLKEEWGFEQGEFVRVYVRYVSGGPEPLAVGIMKERDIPPPDRVALSVQAGGILFYIDENDRWYLQAQDLVIDAAGEEIQFYLKEITNYG